MTAFAIDVEGLAKSFGGKPAVRDVTIQLAHGRILGFLGPNGSGKTTTIRMLCGLLSPDAGRGRCLGFDLFKEPKAIKREVGYMTQRFGLYEDLTIRENLDFVARVYGLAERKRAVADVLTQLGLTARSHQLAGALSGGWKQRLALAACLMHRPRLLLLDEPTAGVDPQARRDFWSWINASAEAGLTVLVSTHHMDEAQRCHELVYISQGHILLRGTVDSIVRGSGLATWELANGEPGALARQVQALPGVLIVAAFGTSLHVSGTDAALLERSLAPFSADPRLRVRRIEPGLEDVFIRMMQLDQEQNP
jgi:ABC-2 type transport system ATP-binding protein